VQTANRVPFLGDLPVLGRLFSSQKDTKDKTELILSITPRLVRGMVPPALVPNEFWSGTENDPRLRPVSRSIRGAETNFPVAEKINGAAP
jgi:general secretion pathway protein D